MVNNVIHNNENVDFEVDNYPVVVSCKVKQVHLIYTNNKDLKLLFNERVKDDSVNYIDNVYRIEINEDKDD